MKKKSVFVLVIIVAVVVIGIFVFTRGGSSEFKSVEGNSVGNGETPVWMEMELTDVNSGETFKISDFRGKPVLLESFAVWCPTCTKQQRNIKDLHAEPGFGEDEVISIGLDTDPNEDEARVRQHAQDNGFTWRYAVAPTDLTQALVDEFGNGIVSAPSAPMVLICEDGSYRKLGGFSARSADKLKSEIGTC